MHGPWIRCTRLGPRTWNQGETVLDNTRPKARPYWSNLRNTPGLYAGSAFSSLGRSAAILADQFLALISVGYRGRFQNSGDAQLNFGSRPYYGSLDSHACCRALTTRLV